MTTRALSNIQSTRATCYTPDVSPPYYREAKTLVMNWAENFDKPSGSFATEKTPNQSTSAKKLRSPVSTTTTMRQFSSSNTSQQSNRAYCARNSPKKHSSNRPMSAKPMAPSPYCPKRSAASDDSGRANAKRPYSRPSTQKPQVGRGDESESANAPSSTTPGQTPTIPRRRCARQPNSTSRVNQPSES